MNAATTIYDSLGWEHKVVSRGDRHTSSPRPTGRKQSPRFSRRGKSPQQFNGIHRRRKKKIVW
ncbi:MAG: hypothetical protein KDA60_13645 [Planctomycetales bacterium]|nr:hypothetical protein [Planctomycetales bacterium]